MQQGNFDTTTNKEHWTDQCWVFDQSNNLVDLSNMEIVMAVQDRDTKTLLATVKRSTPSSSGAIEVVGKGVFQFILPKFSNAKVPRAYDVGCTLTDNHTGVTQQFFITSLNILDGIVP